MLHDCFERDVLNTVKNCIFRRIKTGLLDVGVRFSSCEWHRCPEIKGFGHKQAEAIANQQFGLFVVGGVIPNHIVETTEEGRVQVFGVVGGRHYYAVRNILLDELKKRIKRSSHFRDVVLRATL